MPRLRISFRLLLPILAFALSTTLLAVPTTLTYIGLRQHSLNGGDANLNFNGFSYTVQRDQFFHTSFFGAASTSSHTIQTLNLPAFFIELLISRCSRSWPSGWTPPHIDFLTWRALIFPVYCLPFWYFVGLGLDALFRRRKLRWPPLLLGSMLCGFFLVLVIGLLFGMSAGEKNEMVYAFWGFYFWVVLFAVFPAAWIRQRLLARSSGQ